MPSPKSRTLCGVIVLATALALPSLALPSLAMADDLTIFAASSLKNALDPIATAWQAQTGDSVVISYDSSAKLAKQIEQGAPADLYISASESWMNTLAEGNLIKPETRKDILGNTLVLIASGSDAPLVTLAPNLDLAGLIGTGKLSMALVDSVPAGQYGKEALETLGLWPSVQANVAQSENVRAALALVAAGEAPFGIVYGSDAIADDASGNKVTVVGTFPADSHQPILYPVAQLASSTAPNAQAFLDALSSPASGAIFAAQGFTVLTK